MFYAILVSGLIFDFLNGFHDSSNVVATVISSRAMRPRVALIMAAIAHFCAPFLFGVAVATTIGNGVIDPSAISPNVILASVIASVLWNIITWWLGIPSSSSHALVGGLLGASVLAQGLEIIQIPGLAKILLALFISPPLGMLVGYLIMRIVLFLVRKASPRVSTVFKRLQIFTTLALSLSHGTNDAQKTMGILTMGLVSAGFQETFAVPLWVITASAGAIALGTALGGWRLIRTLGGRIVRIRPIHGFTSQIASASVILSAALLGGPVSTTQVVGSTIMGVGAAERISKVRWQVGREMVVTWLITIPVTAILSAAFYMLLRLFTP
ncbi:MAG: inorganic phosphate transporter [Anaerolineae bacterium SM23_ 63]|nr:MAG: inorganic phosphate transporter [Anaerolineae bacterium SM23_ 63]HEY47075.1 inorganic phosphate transporter [Anaerolineae bacterium]